MLLCGGVLVGSTAARAESPPSPITFVVGVNVRHWQETPGADYYSEFARVDGNDPGIDGLVAYRLAPAIALGVRAAVSYQHYVESGIDMRLSYTDRFQNVLLEPAVTAIFEYGPTWFAPWLGVHIVREHRDSTSFEPSRGESKRGFTSYPSSLVAAGLSAGVDLLTTRIGDLGLVLDLELAGRDYFAAGIGVAFHR
jgi:hypothetical protein